MKCVVEAADIRRWRWDTICGLSIWYLP